jgi:hypothetical protein
VVAGLVAIDVILPEQLDRFRENRDLRVTAVVIPARGVGRIKPDAEKNVEKDEACESAEQKTALHVNSLCADATMIVHAEIFGNAQSVG